MLQHGVGPMRSKDNKDHQGHWKCKRTSDTYEDVQLDWVDTKVTQQFCPGGVACYDVVDPGCTTEWITTNVTPQISEVFGHGLGVHFGKALLWLAFLADSDLMPAHMQGHIIMAHEAVCTMEGSEQPAA